MMNDTPDFLKSVFLATGFLGSLITLSAMPELTKKQMFLAVLSGVAFAYLGTPVVAAWVFSLASATWLPAGGSVEGLIGLFLGMGGIHFVVFLTSVFQNLSKNPIDIILKLLGR